MKSLGAICRPFNHCCSAPAAPKARSSKAIDAGQAQADVGQAQVDAGKAQIDAGKSQIDADKSQIDTSNAQAKAKSDVMEPASQYGQVTEGRPDTGLEEPQASTATSTTERVATPTLPPLLPPSEREDNVLVEPFDSSDESDFYETIDYEATPYERLGVALPPSTLVPIATPPGTVLQPVPPSITWAEYEGNA